MPARIDIPTAATAAELVAHGHSQNETAQRLGISRTTVANILDGEHGWDQLADTPVFRTYRQRQNKALEQAARTLAAKAFSHAESVMEKASFYQAVVGGSILIDKARLLAGESTENVAVLVRHEAEGLDALASVLGQTLLQTGNMASKQSEAGQVTTQVADNATHDGHIVSTSPQSKPKAKARRKS
jgi:predicted transcriptional regulator